MWIYLIFNFKPDLSSHFQHSVLLVDWFIIQYSFYTNVLALSNTTNSPLWMQGRGIHVLFSLCKELIKKYIV